MAFLQTTFDWAGFYRQAGATGVVCLFFGAVIWKVFIPMMKDMVADARAERDYMRDQRAKEVDKFTEALRGQQETFKEALENVIRDTEPRRR